MLKRRRRPRGLVGFDVLADERVPEGQIVMANQEKQQLLNQILDDCGTIGVTLSEAERMAAREQERRERQARRLASAAADLPKFQNVMLQASEAVKMWGMNADRLKATLRHFGIDPALADGGPLQRLDRDVEAVCRRARG